MRFFDRKYLLQIGDYETGDGLEINDLQLTFRVRKSVNNKDKIDKCSISVYNLSNESLSVLETKYPVAVFSCGYGDELVRLFYGEIVAVETKKSGTDRVTTLEITPAFSNLTFQVMSSLVPENGTLEDVFEAIRKETDISKGVYKGEALKTRIVYGYPLVGTPKEMLDQVCQAYNLEWKIENNSLYINDSSTVEFESKELAPVIGETSGLVDRPYYFSGSDRKSSKDKDRKDGVRFTALLNPNVVPGSLARLDYAGTSEFVRIEEVEFVGDFRGNNWYMHCIASRRQEG